MSFKNFSFLNGKNVYYNSERSLLIQHAINNREAIVLKTGTLATWTSPDSTGRSPADTVTVKRNVNESTIDWNSPYNNPITSDTFEMLLEDAEEMLKLSKKIYITERAIGADPEYSLKVTTITNKALTALFTVNMFRELINYKNSIFSDKNFILYVLPDNKLDYRKYKGRLRYIKTLNRTTDMVIAIDYENYKGVIIGSSYMGSVKKLMFTVLNYYLPFKDILPIHCSANEGQNGDVALFLGLSGTGKTTLSTDSERKLLGDDEHMWTDNGIANYENGCYAKLINLDKEKEPEIYDACFHYDDPLLHGAIIENVMVYPDGSFDLFDSRFTENSRGSYPLNFLKNIKETSTGNHPSTIIFLTADANGVLPPVARLNYSQTLLWYLMGYTSKLAGTETGIIEPISTFSRFFGAPFMPANPNFYLKKLREKLEIYKPEVYLINTGWVGGAYPEGKRISLPLTRKIVNLALSGALKNLEYREDSLFHIMVPLKLPGIEDNSILYPEKMWNDKKEYRAKAIKLATEFSNYFDKAFGEKNISEDIIKNCPGK